MVIFYKIWPHLRQVTWFGGGRRFRSQDLAERPVYGGSLQSLARHCRWRAGSRRLFQPLGARVPAVLTQLVLEAGPALGAVGAENGAAFENGILHVRGPAGQPDRLELHRGDTGRSPDGTGSPGHPSPLLPVGSWCRVHGLVPLSKVARCPREALLQRGLWEARPVPHGRSLIQVQPSSLSPLLSWDPRSPRWAS